MTIVPATNNFLPYSVADHLNSVGLSQRGFERTVTQTNFRRVRMRGLGDGFAAQASLHLKCQEAFPEDGKNYDHTRKIGTITLARRIQPSLDSDYGKLLEEMFEVRVWTPLPLDTQESNGHSGSRALPTFRSRFVVDLQNPGVTRQDYWHPQPIPHGIRRDYSSILPNKYFVQKRIPTAVPR